MSKKEPFKTYRAEYNRLVRNGQNVRAMQVLDKVIARAVEKKMDGGFLLKLYKISGKLHVGFTNNSMAIDSFFKALRLAKSELDKVEITYHIANCYMGLKDADNALRFFSWLLEYHEKTKSHKSIPFLVANMSGVFSGLVMVYSQKGRFDKARQIISEHFNPERMESPRPDVAFMDYYHAIGELSMCEKDYDKAEESFRKSMILAEKWNIGDAVVSAKIHLAHIEIIRNNPSGALDAILPCINKQCEKYVGVFTETCLLASKICAFMGDVKCSERMLKKCGKYIKNAEPMWLFKLMKEQDELLKLPLAGPASTQNIVRMSRDTSVSFEPVEIVGNSEEMLKALATARKVAKTDLSILIEGETGTGKELFARLIHYTSNRANGPFVPVNCGGLSESLLETELFGHKKGAFTGAFSDRKGIFEFAAGGTIFLDECAEMPQAMQSNLLRTLEERKMRRVGDNSLIDIDVRIIFATNKSLKDLVAQGKFREDLFFRINVFTLDIPPLRLRKDDIPLLVGHLLEKMQKPGADVQVVKPAMQALMAYNWPGNVRELENEIKRIVGMNKDCTVIDETMLGRHIIQFSDELKPMQNACIDESVSFREFEKRFILASLDRCGNNVVRTAKSISISRSGMIKKMKRLGISITRTAKGL
ncbi:MAG: sigma 54-interacting transcriptional regulator [Planctomycetes bacterium]|nr:sigma 54-interacting transcriptional regulator [Planctomycetota bacterium]